MLIKKELTESMVTTEKILKTKKTYSGGEDIVTRHLSPNWDDISKVESTWERDEEKNKT